MKYIFISFCFSPDSVSIVISDGWQVVVPHWWFGYMLLSNL